MANLAEVNKTLVQQNEILIGIAQSTDATEKMMLDEIRKTNKFKEAGLLKLNSKKSLKILKWKTLMSFNDTLRFTSDWYKNYYNKKSKVITSLQIKNYFKRLNIKI